MTPDQPEQPKQITITELVDRVNAAAPRMSRSNPNRHLILQLGAGLVEVSNASARQQAVIEARTRELADVRDRLGKAAEDLFEAYRTERRRNGFLRWLFPWRRVTRG